MTFKNKQLLIYYLAKPKPCLELYLFAKTKTGWELLIKSTQKLEAYQLNGNAINDFQVIAERFNQELIQEEKGIKDGIIFIYDLPDSLYFNTILPKTMLSKAKLQAKKELNDLLRLNQENYHNTARIVNTKDKGIIFYYDLIPQKILDSFEKLANPMNRYLDSHSAFVKVLASYYEEVVKGEKDTFLIYQKEQINHIILLFNNRLIDAISTYEGLTNAELLSNIELLRNKHLFAFEKQETNHLVFLQAIDQSLIADLKRADFIYETIEYLEEDLYINAINFIDDFQLGFVTKLT